MAKITITIGHNANNRVWYYCKQCKIRMLFCEAKHFQKFYNSINISPNKSYISNYLIFRLMQQLFREIWHSKTFIFVVEILIFSRQFFFVFMLTLIFFLSSDDFLGFTHERLNDKCFNHHKTQFNFHHKPNSPTFDLLLLSCSRLVAFHIRSIFEMTRWMELK